MDLIKENAKSGMSHVAKNITESSVVVPVGSVICGGLAVAVVGANIY